MTFSETFLERIESNKTERQTLPDYELVNPLDAEVFVTGIVLVPDSYFQLKGKAIVTINGTVVFDEQDSEAFKDVEEMPIALTQKILGRSQKIQVWIWNAEDSDTVALTVNAKLSENQDETFASVKAVNSKTQKDNVSLIETPFPLQNRAAGSYPYLLDMKGYKKLIVMITRGEPANLPLFVASTFPAGSTARTIDGLLGTDGVTRNGAGSSEFVADWLTQAPRKITLRAQHGAGGGDGCTGSVTYDIWGSNDGVNWGSPILTQGFSVGLTVQTVTLLVPEYSFRYYKFRITTTTSGSCTSSSTVYEFFDRDSLGGTGQLSFQVLNAAGRWGTLIPSSEFGTVSDETQDITAQVGDVTTISVSGKTHNLPSTQTHFRILYVVSNFGLTNSVQILRVA